MKKLIFKLETTGEDKSTYQGDIELSIELRTDGLEEYLHAFKIFLKAVTFSSDEIVSNSRVQGSTDVLNVSTSSEDFMK